MRRKLSYIVSCLLLSGCSATSLPSLSQKFSISLLNPLPSTEYALRSFTVNPQFSVIASDNNTLNTFSLELSAYQDAACINPSQGLFSLDQNPVTVQNQKALFSGASYAPLAHQEETLYLKAQISNSSQSVCVSGPSILQKWNYGIGYVLGPSTGLAGATGSSESDLVRVINIDSLNRILVATYSIDGSSNRKTFLTRYWPDGTLDSTFNAGVGSWSSATGGYSSASPSITAPVSIAFDTQQRIYLLGYDYTSTPTYRILLFRFSKDGILDSTFGGGTGYYYESATTSVAGLNPIQDLPNAFVLHPNGKIYVAGESKASTGLWNTVLWRFNSDGTIDSTFGTSGAVVYPSFTGAGTNDDDAFYNLSIDSNGKLLALGRSRTTASTSTAGGYTAALARINPDGTLDTSFAGTGYYLSPQGTGPTGLSAANQRDYFESVTVSSTGDLFVSGVSYNAATTYQGVVWKIKSNGTLDTSFGNSGYYTYGSTNFIGGTGEFFFPVTIQSDGSLVFVGRELSSSSTFQIALLKLTANGVLDSSFGSGGTLLESGTYSFAGGTGTNAYDIPYTSISDSHGRILIGAGSKNTAGGMQFLLLRYHPSGQLDL